MLDNNGIITTAQAAEILGVSRCRILTFIYQGRLPAKKIGRDWQINEVDLTKVRKRRCGRPRKRMIHRFDLM
jgi:excisionase family DNA binding protein